MSAGAYSPGNPEFTFHLSHSSDGKSRKIWGVTTTEAPDREKEIITEEAIMKALSDFMVLPIIHYYHSERPIGWITKAKYGDVLPTLKEFGIESQGPLPERGLVVIGEIKNTPDANDVWDAIEKGEISEWSIYGSRKSGSPECRVPSNMRSKPCITKAMYLWSISLCPRGTGQNRTTLVEVVKAITSGGTNLIHPTVDDKDKRSITKMDPQVQGSPPGGDVQPGVPSQGGNDADLMKEILAKVNAILEHLGGDVSGGGDEEEKSTDEPGESSDDSVPRPTSKNDLAKAEGDVEDEEEDKKMEKCKDIKKAEETVVLENDSIVKAQADRITQLEKELDDLKKATPAPRTIVIDPSIQKANKATIDGSSPESPGVSRYGRLLNAINR